MQALIHPRLPGLDLEVKRRSPLSPLLAVLSLLVTGITGLQAQTAPTITSNFTVGPVDGTGATTVEANWSTVSEGTDRFDTNPGSNPVGDTTLDGANPATTFSTRFDMTLGDGANLFASNCASLYTHGVVNFAGPGGGTNSKLVNYGNLNSYYDSYPSQYPLNYNVYAQTWGTLNLNYVDFTNCGNVGTLNGQVGFLGGSGVGNSYTVDASNGTVTNYGTIVGINNVGSNGFENYGHLLNRNGKGILNRADAPVNNYSGAGFVGAYNASYGFDGNPTVNATWNNWGYISWWITGVQMITATGTFSDYGGPLVPCALSNATAADGGTSFASTGSKAGSFAPANENFTINDLTYGGTITCGYDDADPFSSTYSPFNYGTGAAVIVGVNKIANFYNTIYTVSQAGAVTPAGTKVNFFPVLYGPITSGTTSTSDSTNDPIGAINLHFDGLSPSEIQDVQYAVAQTSIYTQGILDGTTTYAVPRGTDYKTYYASGSGHADRPAGALPNGPGHSAYVNIRGANYNWLDFLNVTFTHQNDLTADPVPGVFMGTTQSPAYYFNPAGNLRQTAVSTNVAGTYVSSGQARDVGSTLSGLSANPGGVSSVGAVVQLNGQTTSTQNGNYVVTALSPGGALLRLNPALPPAAYTLDDAGATLSGTGDLTASLTPSSPALVQGAFVRVTMQANPVQDGYYTVGALAVNSWTLVRSSSFQGNPSTYSTTANLSASYQTPSFTISGGVASLKGAANGPILLNAGVVPGDVVLVSGRANPTAGGLYWVQNAGSATTPWVLNRFAAEAGLGAQWVTSANLAGSYISSGQPGDIGSTLTGSGNGALPTVINGNTDVDVDLGTVILVNAQTNAAQNGVYKITALGDGSHPWTLQRVQLTQNGTPTAASEAAALRSLIYPAATGALQLTVYTETNNVTNIGSDPIQFTAKYSTSLPRQKYNYTSPTTVTLTGNQGLTPGATTNVQAGWALQLGSQLYGDNTAMTSPTPTGSIVLDSAYATATGYNVDGQTNTSKMLSGTLVLANGLSQSFSASNIAGQFVPNPFVQTTNPNHQLHTAIPNDTRLYIVPPPPQTPVATAPLYLPDITGTGDIFQAGSGMTYLTTALTGFTGNIYISHGKLVLAPSTPLAACGLTMESWDNTPADSGMLDCSNVVNGQIKLRWLQGVQNQLKDKTCRVPGIALGSNKLMIGSGRRQGDPAMVYQGQINGTGGVELLSGVDMTLGGALASYNTYSGGTVVDPGAVLRMSTFPMEADGSSRMLGTGNLTNNGTITLVAGATQDGGVYPNPLTNLPSNLQKVGAMGSGGNHLVYVGGSYTQSGNLTLKVNSLGASAGGSFGLYSVSDSLQAAGGITLQPGATLTLSEVNPATITSAATVVLAQGASIGGTFSGLPNGANVVVGGNLWTIHYSSTQITLTAPANVAVPALQTPTVGNGLATLTWSASAGATSYNVKRATVSGGPYTTVGTASSNTYPDSALTNGTTYYYVVTAVRGSYETANSNQVGATPEPGNGTLPKFYQSADIGTVGIAGSASYSNGTYTLNGSGNDIYHTADEFQFASRPVTGDVTLTVKVASQTTTSQDKSGLMIRASSDPASVFADVTIHQSLAIKMEYRTTTGGSATGGQNTSITSAPYWLRLVRMGNVFTSFYSPDGAAWTQLRATTIVMPATVMVGLVQCSHDDTVLSTGTFTNYSVVAVPSPWQSLDVGSVAAAGSAVDTAGVFQVTGSGADVYGTADAFRYTYQTATGDCDITARVTDVQTTQPYAKAGVMIRETTSANSSQMSVFVTPQQGVEADVRNGTGASTTVTHGAASSAVPYWVRITRVGNTFTAYNSPDGSTWTAIGPAVTIPMSTNVDIGLAISSHADGALNTATLDQVTATP